MQVHFISDLHLSVDRPALTAVFERYLAGPPGMRKHSTYWVIFTNTGRVTTIMTTLSSGLERQLAALAEAGTRIHFMPGNRDFLIGADFARRCRLTILPEPSLIHLGTQAVLLCHGDSLCTDDVGYQAFRKQVRTPAYQAIPRPAPCRPQAVHRRRTPKE
jgi:UDP-2,3-diacylglucosamine hydrolase